jgi:hypothetical protein
MAITKNVVAIATGLAVVSATMFGVTAEARTHHWRIAHKAYYRPIYSDRGNDWNGKPDNSCLSLPYLLDMEACAARGKKRN